MFPIQNRMEFISKCKHLCKMLQIRFFHSDFKDAWITIIKFKHGYMHKHEHEHKFEPHVRCDCKMSTKQIPRNIVAIIGLQKIEKLKRWRSKQYVRNIFTMQHGVDLYRGWKCSILCVQEQIMNRS